MGRRTMIEANGGHRIRFRGFRDETNTYVCVNVLWERMDVRWELYLCKTTIYIYIEDLWDLGLGIVTYWSRHA